MCGAKSQLWLNPNHCKGGDVSGGVGDEADADGGDGGVGDITLKQTRREKGRVTRKRLQDTPSRIPPQTHPGLTCLLI